MCGRYMVTLDADTLAGRFMLESADLSATPRYNVAPTQRVLVVLGDGERNRAEYMRWGLIPSWAKDPSVGSRMINARAESVAEKPSFRQALQKRRCLIVADGFYEWKKQGSAKIPTRVVLKSREPFGFAGLWDEWESTSGEVIRSCAIITTPANDLVVAIHDRMPAILSRDAEAIWLDPTIEDPLLLTSLLKPYPSEKMEYYEVSPAVNSAKNEDPSLAEPKRAER